MTNVNDITAIELDWYRSWAVFPCRTVSKKWIWLKPVYVRRVWKYTGFADEPFTEYGTILDVLKTSNPL